jgi:hypothetical protein
MRRSISIIGSVLLAAALISPAWAKPGKGNGVGGGGGEIEGQHSFARVIETAATCTVVSSSASAGPVIATFIADGDCLITFSGDVAVETCSAVATIVGDTAGEIAVNSTMKTALGDSWEVFTFDLAGTPAAANFNLIVTCP